MADLLNAFRVWRRRPLVAAAVILTFALGAGANLSVFGLIWGVMLRPLPYADPGRIMQVWQDDGKEARKASDKPLIQQWRENNRSFESLANYRPWQLTVSSGGGEPENVRAGLVSAEFFATLGVAMQAGHAFTREETRAGTDRAIILTHGFWTRRFSADRTILNREILADGEVCRVVGILPPDYRGVILGGAREADVYMPISRARSGVYTLPTSFVAGRLKPGITRAQAQADLAAIAAAVPKFGYGGVSRRVWISPLQDEVGLSLRPALLALFGATICVLLVACFNIANLLMAHAAARQRELAIRAAMGAGRARLIRQLMVESLTLALVGGVAAFAAAAALTRTLLALYPNGLPRTEEPLNDGVTIAAAVLITLGCGLLVGLLPAWRVTGGNMEDWLRVGHGWMARARRRWADALVAAQVMLTVAVLIGAGLLLKGFMVLRNADPGFQRENVVTAAIGLPVAAYGKRPEQSRFAAQLTERLRNVPGVIASGLTNALPLRYTVLLSITFRVGGEPEQVAPGRGVSGNYFQAMGMRMVSGRPLGPEDDGRKDVLVVNEAFARRYLPGREALGFQFPQDNARIVGVVKDVLHHGLAEPAPPEIYFPLSKLPSAALGIAVRSTLPTSAVAAALRREVAAIDSGLALEKIMTLEEVVEADLARPRFQTILLGLFAAVALALAAIGGYSVVAQNLRTRTQEFGVRRAVGAQTGDILALVAREGMRAPLLGLALGCGLAWVASRYLASMLFGISPNDAAVWLAALSAIAAVCLAACAWAARLAIRVQPTEALRNE